MLTHTLILRDMNTILKDDDPHIKWVVSVEADKYRKNDFHRIWPKLHALRAIQGFPSEIRHCSNFDDIHFKLNPELIQRVDTVIHCTKTKGGSGPFNGILYNGVMTMDRFAVHCKMPALSAALLMGDARAAMKTLQGGCDIVVGTPARVVDFVKRGKCDVSAIQLLVLDEADRLCDHEGMKSIGELFQRLPMPAHLALPLAV